MATDTETTVWPAAPMPAATEPASTLPVAAGVPVEVYSRREALPLLYRPAIWLLGVIGAVCVVGMIAVPLLGQQVSDGLIAIGSLAVGALANMIARESGGNG